MTTRVQGMLACRVAKREDCVCVCVCVCVYVRWQEYAAMRLHLYASSGGVFVRFAQKLIFIYEFLRLEPVALGSVAAVRRLVL